MTDIFRDALITARLHILTHPLLYTAIALASGIALAPLIPIPPLAVFVVMILAALASAFMLIPRFRTCLLATVLILALFLGMYLYHAENKEISSFPIDKGDYLTVSGTLSSFPVQTSSGMLRLTLDIQRVNGEEYRKGSVYVYADNSAELSGLSPGSTVTAFGKSAANISYGNSNAFNYNQYLLRQGIYASIFTQYGGYVVIDELNTKLTPATAGASLRSSFFQALEAVPDQRAALIKGVFLGDKGDLSFSARETLTLAGAMHAFAVSGLHIGFIFSLAALITPANRRLRIIRLLLSVIFVIIYINITGGSASIFRASLMGFCLLLAFFFDERTHAPTSLALAAIICLLIHPLWIFDAGFQLSFVAVSGIILLTPCFRQLLQKLPKKIGLALSVSLAATVATMPLISYYFFNITWLGWLIAPVVIAGAGAAVIISFITVLVSVISIPVASLLLEGAGLILDLMLRTNEALLNIPFSFSVTGIPPKIAVFLFYLILLIFPLLFRKFRLTSTLLLAMTVFLFSLSPGFGLDSRYSFSSLDGEIMEVTFIDVGQGDCALVVLPDDTTILIDGGGSSNQESIGRYVLLPYLKSRGIYELDYCINSHPHADHIYGINFLLEHIPVDHLIYSPIFDSYALQRQMLEVAVDQGTELIPVTQGDLFLINDLVKLTFYSPEAKGLAVEEETNESSLVFELSYGEIDFLFTGDADKETLELLADTYDLEAEVLKIPHHGSDSSFSRIFYEDCASEIAIISVGNNNIYGHPHRSVVEYWEEEASLFRTDLNGAISIFSDGDNLALSYVKNQ